MGDIHTYFGIENVALTAPQRNTLIDTLKSLGSSPQDPQPANRNHWRVRLDNEAVIFHATFDEATLSIDAIKNRLANIFGVSASLITHTTQQSAYGLAVTFSYQSVARLRSISFGYNGGWPSWEESKEAVLTYLQANAVAWEGI